MSVNVRWQMIATLFLPSGLYAFKRINKLKSGILVYIASFGITLLSSVLTSILFMTKDGQYNLLMAFYALGVLILSIILPMYYIRNWSIEFNKKIGKEIFTSSQAVRS